MIKILPLDAISFYDVWDIDKSLLRGAKPDLEINWDSSVLTSEVATLVYQLVGEMWQNPQNPLVLDETSLSETVDHLTPLIVEVWGSDFLEKLDIELHDLDS